MSRPSLAGVLARRVRDGAVVIVLVVVVIFVLAYMVGDPASVFAPVDASHAEIAALRHNLGFDRPFITQFADYFGGLFKGDFGESTWQHRPAIDAVMEALPNTVLLSVAGITIAGVLGSVGGVLAGGRPGSIFDRIGNTMAVIAVSVPNFWLGLMLIALFAVKLKMLPTSGYYSSDALILPALTLGLVHGGRIFLLVRSVTFEEMSKPYALVARSKGLSRLRVLGQHVLRNAGVTIATTVGWEYVRMMAGAAFVIEFVFAWPGIGTLMINAASRQDFPILQAAVIVTGIFVVGTNIAVDMISQFVDRRVQAA